jgi:hypothetical protein
MLAANSATAGQKNSKNSFNTFRPLFFQYLSRALKRPQKTSSISRDFLGRTKEDAGRARKVLE